MRLKEGFAMSFFQRLFGASRPPASVPSSAPESQTHSHLSSGASQRIAASQNTTRREMLRVVLRETLQRLGIPVQWIGAECLTATSRKGERGVHCRLLVKHWDARILTHGVAIQQALIKRVMAFDPTSPTWLNGVSWQFALPDESACPPLPHPGSWTSEPHGTHQAHEAPDAAAGTGIIEGPVRIAAVARHSAPASDADAARADLDRLLAVRDADFRQYTSG